MALRNRETEHATRQQNGRIEKRAGEGALSCLSRERLGKVDPIWIHVDEMWYAGIEFTIDSGLKGMVCKEHAGSGQKTHFGGIAETASG